MRITGVNNSNVRVGATATKQDRRVTNKPIDKPIPTNQTTTNRSSIQKATQEQSSSNNNIKIETYLRTVSQLEQRTNKLESQIQYYARMEEWLANVFNVKQESGSNLKSLMTATSKLNILEKQAIFAASKPFNKVNTQQTTSGRKCSVSSHLTYLFSQNTSRKQRISQLLKTRQQLYQKIQQTLLKEQPYLHQKILKKIQRQVKKQTKIQAINELKKVIKQKQNWLKSTQSQIGQKIDEKLIEQKLTNNLQKMKEIMNKKILNNQYICEVIGNQAEISRNVERFRKVAKEVRTTIKGEIAKMENNIQEELNQMERGKEMRRKYVEFDEVYIREIQDLISEGEEYLRQPLETSSSPFLQQEYQRIEKQLNALSNKLS